MSLLSADVVYQPHEASSQRLYGSGPPCPSAKLWQFVMLPSYYPVLILTDFLHRLPNVTLRLGFKSMCLAKSTP